ncbi:hypothetical protein AOLI_G00261250 [Acnodon oligacanthus]
MLPPCSPALALHLAVAMGTARQRQILYQPPLGIERAGLGASQQCGKTLGTAIPLLSDRSGTSSRCPADEEGRRGGEPRIWERVCVHAVNRGEGGAGGDGLDTGRFFRLL